MMKVAGEDLYLAPKNRDGRIRNGSPVEVTSEPSYRCIWFWNGRRLRHITGRWLRVNDDNKLVVQMGLAGKKSLF